MASYESWPDRFPQPPLPPIAPIGIALHDLSPEKRKRIWQWMQRNDPAMVTQLNSPEYQALRAAFNATIVLPRDYIECALQAVAA